MSKPMKKVTKLSVNYRNAQPNGDCCGDCAMFHSPKPGVPGSCDLVEGRIRATGVCDKWVAASKLPYR